MADQRSRGGATDVGTWISQVRSFRRLVVFMVMLCCLGLVTGFVLQSTVKLVDSFRSSDGSSMFASVVR